MHLEKFIILGHSMGGFLAASYAIEYPDRYIYRLNCLDLLKPLIELT